MERVGNHSTDFVSNNLFKGASTDVGWGGKLLKPKKQWSESHGVWPPKQALLHINDLELIAACHIITVFIKLYDFHDVNWLHKVDNNCTKCYINHQGGRVKRFNKIVKPLWNPLIERNIRLKCEHLAGEKNVIADELSRRVADRHDWKVNPVVFRLQ